MNGYTSPLGALFEGLLRGHKAARENALELERLGLEHKLATSKLKAAQTEEEIRQHTLKREQNLASALLAQQPRESPGGSLEGEPPQTSMLGLLEGPEQEVVRGIARSGEGSTAMQTFLELLKERSAQKTALLKQHHEDLFKGVPDEQRFALEEFGAPFRSLNPTQQATVNKRIKDTQVDISRGRIEAQSQETLKTIDELTKKRKLAELDVEQTKQPLDTKARFWLDTEGNPASPSLTPKDAKSKGYVPVTEHDLTAVQNAKTALGQIQEYRDLAPKLLTHEKASKFAQAIGVTLNRMNIGLLHAIGDPDASRLYGLFGTIATAARATGDTANIAVAERQMLKESFFTPSDTIESANVKLDMIERIMRSVVAGRNVPIPGPAAPERAPRKLGQSTTSTDPLIDLKRVRDAFAEGKATEEAVWGAVKRAREVGVTLSDETIKQWIKKHAPKKAK